MRLVPNTRPRYVLGLRIHHGLVGVILGVIGLVLAWDDRRDFPWRLKDRRQPFPDLRFEMQRRLHSAHR